MGLMMQSIRWRLPLSYAAIALVAVVSLATILLTTLHDYYEQQEFEHLMENARAVSEAISRNYEKDTSSEALESQLRNLSFLAQARIMLYNINGEIIADSGSPQANQMISISARRPTQDFVIYGSDFGQPYVDSTITIFNQPIQEIQESPSPTAPTDAMFFGTSDTPFGRRLSRDSSPEQRSEQKVQSVLLDGHQQPIGYIQLSEGPAFGTKILDSVTQALVGAGAISVTLAILAGFFISYQLSQPVLMLANTTQRMSDGDLSARVNLKRRDEFGILAHSFNEMATRVETTITTLRSFVADAAHELHTPITALHANLELALTEPQETKKAHFISQSLGQLKRLESMTNDLLDLSRIESGMGREERHPVNLVEVLRETSELYASRAEQSGVQFQLEVPAKGVITRANEAQLRQVICNLLDNAIKFTPENGAITVGLCKEVHEIKLWVKDSGIGIPTEDLPYLFSRFHRGRNAAPYPGSGLGLAITRAIVEGHQGKVSVESSIHGTAFLLQLPVV